MDNKAQLTGLKKRQQISAANKMIFVWIVGASVIVSMCLVGGQFLVRQALFNQKIITAKGATVNTLNANIKNVATLTRAVDALVANQDLAAARANPTDSTLKVVLDALPTENNLTGLASSLQNVVLKPSGVSVQDLGISQQTTAETADGPASQTAIATNFTFGVRADYAQTQTMLKDMERSIRPIDVKTLSLQGQGAALQVNVNADTYYLPPRTVKLGSKEVKP